MKIKNTLSDMDEYPILKYGDQVLRLEIDPLTSFDKEVAIRELRETPENTTQALEKLKLLIKEESNLSVPLHNEDWLIRFLRPCKFYPESALNLIKRYYKFKIKHKDIYDKLTPMNEPNIFHSNILTVLLNRDQFGRRILILELGKKWNYKKVSLNEVFKGSVIFLEAAMLEPPTQVNGTVVIFDMDGLSVPQACQFTPHFAKTILEWLQDAVPLRIKAIHIINEPKIFQVVFALFKPFLREKLKSRMYFHGYNRQSLHNHINSDCLSPAYGGTSTIQRLSGDQWYELLLKYEKEYHAVNAYGYKL